MSLKDQIKNTFLFNKIKETGTYWKIKDKFIKDIPVHVYLTLACNLMCSYCVNQANLKESKLKYYKIAPGKNWVKALNRANKTIIFTGGEPTLHPDFIEIINGIKKELPIIVYTNFIWPEKFTDKFIKELKRPIKVLGSA